MEVLSLVMKTAPSASLNSPYSSGMSSGSLPPVEGVFYDGQMFDAYAFASDLIKSARKSLVLIDNYIDESVLLMLSKRQNGVMAEIRTG